MENNNAAAIDALYSARKARREHPCGKFDNAGRWYPSDSEEQDCCKAIRQPSRAFPYSLMLHCRSKKHIAHMLSQKAE